MVEISASVLSVKKEEAIKTFYNLETAKIDYFHIDVMDGKFVEQDTADLMLEYTEYIKSISNLPIDVHLMVEDVYSYVQSYIALDPNIITFHYEAVKKKEDIKELINLIKENDIKVGISIKPETKLEEIKEFFPYLHQVLIMTVEPGYGGQTLIESTINKIKELKEYIEKENLELDIEVDGGINLQTN
ncbi:MAG: ribulose-phosphate 3-epimerase, partial [Clostridia bacterium]